MRVLRQQVAPRAEAQAVGFPGRLVAECYGLGILPGKHYWPEVASPEKLSHSAALVPEGWPGLRNGLAC